MKTDIIQKSIAEFLKTFSTKDLSYTAINSCYDEARYRCINTESSFKIEIFNTTGTPVITYTLKESLLGNMKWKVQGPGDSKTHGIALFLLVHYVRDLQKEPEIPIGASWLSTIYQTYL